MATNGSDMPPGAELPPQAVAEDSDEDICVICFCPKENPLTLGCQHSFCLVCIEFITSESEAERCPVCRKRFNISKVLAKSRK
ncbi:E3 ubiquitin/ISG15 ligase TRIM25 [Drosophila madeirensis]|uniref:E3 ubiquitin/ISG15 ligase TRIM25 n=1 Tax=Drosophila madeirensis TaxID=30013 RepID=A0AAU9FJQ9_DROMD